MNHELLSIESAGKLANYEKLKKEIENLKAFVKTDIQYCREIGPDGAFECCVEELEKVLEMLEEIDLK